MGKQTNEKEKVDRQANSDQILNALAMLDSTHDDEISNGCVLLYQNIEKSDDNKLALLNADGCVSKLYEHLGHECLSVKRLSSMILASLSLHADVRKYLRKLPKFIQSLICLLENEEDAVLVENVLLCLSSLALEWGCKATICDLGGLTSIMGCLSRLDPDVVKNALQALALVLQDHDAKAAFHACNNVEQLFGFLSSKYSVIKLHAIAVLKQASEHCHLRSDMCTRGLVEILTRFLKDPSNGDLHSYALDLLSKCLSAAKAVQEFCNLCGVKVLLGFLKTDSDEEKKSVRKETKNNPSISRQKKYKEAEERLSQSKMESVLMPVRDVKDSVFECLQWIAAQLTYYKRLQLDEELDNFLLELSVGIDASSRTMTSFVNLIGVLSHYVKSRLFFGQSAVITEKVFSSFNSENIEHSKALAFFLSNLTYECPTNCSLLAEKIVTTTSQLLKSKDEEVLLNSCDLATNLSCCLVTRVMLIHAGVQTAEIFKRQTFSLRKSKMSNRISEPFLRSSSELPFHGSEALIEKCLIAMSYLSVDSIARGQFIQSGVLKLTVDLLAEDRPAVYRSASLFISRLAVDSETCNLVCELGGLEALYSIQNSRTKRNPMSEIALNELFKCRLVEKFALQGYLSYEDVIENGFYDVGQLDASKVEFSSLGSLESYAAQQPQGQDGRPIFVVNAIFPASSPPSRMDGGSSADLLSTTSKVSSAQTTKSKTKKTVKPPEKVIKEEVIPVINESEKVFEAPNDPDLYALVEACDVELSWLPTTKEKVVALAEAVSSHMGGQVVREYLYDFEWENHIDKLKEQSNSNLIPLGAINFGIHHHRGLLFKFLAEKVGISCSLTRREYNRSFVEVTLLEERKLCNEFGNEVEQLVPERFVVDLIFQPGRLIPVSSPDADSYSMY